MKDPADNVTRDLIDSPRRGRPVTGKAKTKAQIQKEYRQRKKAANPDMPTLSQALIGFHVEELGKGCCIWRNVSGIFPLSYEGACFQVRCFNEGEKMICSGAKIRIVPAVG